MTEGLTAGTEASDAARSVAAAADPMRRFDGIDGEAPARNRRVLGDDQQHRVERVAEFARGIRRADRAPLGYELLVRLQREGEDFSEI